MANAFDKYGKTKAEHFGNEGAAKIPQFNEVSGGGASVDPFGDDEGKKKQNDMNMAEAFNKKDLSKVDAMGTDCPKTAKKQVEEHYDGEHFDQSVANPDIAPFGTDAGKTKSGHSDR